MGAARALLRDLQAAGRHAEPACDGRGRAAWGEAELTEFVTVICYRCKETFGLERSSYNQLQRSEATFHCPWGHAQHFAPGESEEAKLRRERDRLKQQIARVQEEAQIAFTTASLERRRAAAARGQITKLKKRVHRGVCPCCNRQFAQLEAHMMAKHPGFMQQPLDQDQVA